MRELVIPAAPMIPGFAGMISLIDRESGSSIGITLGRRCKRCRWDEEAAAGVHRQATQSDDATLEGVETYGVADSFLTPNET